MSTQSMWERSSRTTTTSWGNTKARCKTTSARDGASMPGLRTATNILVLGWMTRCMATACTNGAISAPSMGCTKRASRMVMVRIDGATGGCMTASGCSGISMGMGSTIIRRIPKRKRLRLGNGRMDNESAGYTILRDN